MVPAASWPMMIGGWRRPVLPSMPWMSLPQMPQAATRSSTSSAADLRHRPVLDFQMVVSGEYEGFHGAARNLDSL